MKAANSDGVANIPSSAPIFAASRDIGTGLIADFLYPGAAQSNLLQWE